VPEVLTTVSYTQQHTNLAIFWAKTSKDKYSPHGYHPLLCHLIDVANVAREMWQSVLPRAARTSLAHELGMSDEEACAIVAWLVGIHDLGKASPPFALRDGVEHLHQLYNNLSVNGRVPARDAPHGFVTTQALPEILCELNFPKRLAKQLAVVIGGHHGTFPRSDDLNQLEAPNKIGTRVWQTARRDLACELARLFHVPTEKLNALKPDLDNATLMWIAGLTTVADWIGSNQTYFKCRVEDASHLPVIDFAEYAEHSQIKAQEALAKLGWTGWQTPIDGRSFEELFPSKFPHRRPVQNAAVTLAETTGALASHGIVIVEAPMGEGKTEAAMYLADYWSVQLKTRGCYFALPTQATSNQMFGRVRDFLRVRADGQTTLQLLHGHAALSAEFELLLNEGRETLDNYQIAGIHDDDKKHNLSPREASIIAAEWFTYRKRGLLAPFGVGTIDQSLLAALQTPHVFVRLFALAHKVIIIDEVHAYDAYMSTLLERLLAWLAALGSPVILLSATLPRHRRTRLLQAYTSGLTGTASSLETALADIESKASYPRITWANDKGCDAVHIAPSPDNTRTLHLEWLDAFDNSRSSNTHADNAVTHPLGVHLRSLLTDDDDGTMRGCVAVICNTVARAQKVYQSLCAYFASANDKPQLDLLHARFLFHQRAAREARTLERFGKPSSTPTNGTDPHRPRCAILVATQIIEQSLDIDFDLMISELAPVDLLLQRAGRLHRHTRQEPRPPKFHNPTLILIKPELDAHGVPDFDSSAYVYASHILLRSWLALNERTARGCTTIKIPHEIEELIETVYDDSHACPPDVSEEIRCFWESTQLKLETQQQDDQREAEDRWLKPPTYEGHFWRIAGDPRAEDSPEFHKAHQALTRLTEVTVQVICLYGDDDKVYLDADLKEPVNLDSAPALELTKKLLFRSLPVSSRRVVNTLLASEVPQGWRKSALLRNHRLVILNPVISSIMIGKYLFRLSDSLGLEINDKE
jgi:CRISPR-associated endonuclease/helicase Cas3